MYPNKEFVRGSPVRAIGYDPDAKAAYVEYANGAKYIYRGVPASEFAMLRAAPSVDSYLTERIKNTYVACRIG